MSRLTDERDGGWRRVLLGRRGDWLACVVFLLLCALLWRLELMPPRDPEPGTKERAVVLSVDDSGVERMGLMLMGTQRLEVEVRTGRHAGQRFPAANELRAQLDLDKMFVPGDAVWVAMLHGAEPGVTVIQAQDHYRLGWTALLFGLFCVLLLAFAGMTGLKALVSFVFSCVAVWRLVVPLCLRGHSPLSVSVVCVCLLTAVIIFLVAGLTRKGVVAFLGSMLGVLAGCALAEVFTVLFHVSAAGMPYAPALLYSGYERLDLQALFAGAIILASSGAVMDLGMDVAAGMEEVSRHRPGISGRELTLSGLRIGQSVVGTMTTTLLLAYSGGYLTLLMVFAAQGTGLGDIINNPYVAAECVKTLVGSFGLVLVAPFTALVGGVLHAWRRA